VLQLQKKHDVVVDHATTFRTSASKQEYLKTIITAETQMDWTPSETIEGKEGCWEKQRKEDTPAAVAEKEPIVLRCLE